MSEPSVYTHCSGRNLGVHGCGVCSMNGADESVKAPPNEMDWEDMYPLSRCGSGVTCGGTYFVWEACVLIVDSVRARELRSVHLPRRWILCRAESPGAAVSPMWNPIRASMISADNVEGVSETYSMPLLGIPF
jgi:hypothetical protein